jgi:hypothetical protein
MHTKENENDVLLHIGDGALNGTFNARHNHCLLAPTQGLTYLANQGTNQVIPLFLLQLASA